MHVCRSRYQLQCAAVALIKKKLMGAMLQRIRYKRLLRAKKHLHGIARGYIMRSTAIHTFAALLRIQRAAKEFLNRRRRARLLLASALKVQNRFRGYAVRAKYYQLTKILAIRRAQRTANKVVRRMQAVWRGKLVAKRFQEVFSAAIKLQSWARARSMRSKFAKLVKLVLWLQCTARRISAQNKSHSVIVTNMVSSELGLLSDLFQREVASIRSIPNNQRILGSGYLRNGISKFERYLISFDVNFDLSFAYPNGWLSTVLDFSRRLREEEKKIIAKIVTGSHHTVLLDDCDNIYTMGFGDLGQLGHNNRLSFPQPHKIEKLSQYLVSATTAATAVPSSTSTTFYASSASNTAAAVSRSLSQNVSVKDICCGKDHTLLLTGELPVCAINIYC